MSETIGRFPYQRVEFTKHGAIFAPDQVSTLLNRIEDENWNELIAISHGWKNDTDDAGQLYRELLQNADALLGERSYGGLGGRRIGVLGIFWPSKKFTDSDLIPGGGASVPSPEAGIREELSAIVDYSARPDAAEKGARAADLWDSLEDDGGTRNEFVEIVEYLLDDGTAEGELTADFSLHPPDMSGSELLEFLGDLELDSVDEEYVGGAAGLGDFFNGIKRGAGRFMNQLTYFEMKKRAGLVGETGVAEVLRRIGDRHPGLGLHLVGHSFGGRLVSAAAKALADQGRQMVKTATLLQAAFSHNGFAENFFHTGRNGYFRPVLQRRSVTHRIAVTHTQADSANRSAYPIASRLHRADASAASLGGPDDRFGAIGANGALYTPEAAAGRMVAATADYSFPNHRLVNLLADGFVRDHNDVKNRHVANLVLHVLAETV